MLVTACWWLHVCDCMLVTLCSYRRIINRERVRHPAKHALRVPCKRPRPQCLEGVGDGVPNELVEGFVGSLFFEGSGVGLELSSVVHSQSYGFCYLREELSPIGFVLRERSCALTSDLCKVRVVGIRGSGGAVHICNAVCLSDFAG